MAKKFFTVLLGLCIMTIPSYTKNSVIGNQLVKREEIKVKIRGIVWILNSSFSCELMIWDVSTPKAPIPITDARITLNDIPIQCNNAEYIGNVPCPISTGTKARIKIWLKKNNTISIQKIPDYVLEQTITNTLTLLFPTPANNKINLAQDPTPTFRWSFTGPTENTCVFLKAQNGQILNAGDACSPTLNYSVTEGLLAPNRTYMLHIETCLREMNFSHPPAPDSKVGFAQKILAQFHTEPN